MSSIARLCIVSDGAFKAGPLSTMLYRWFLLACVNALSGHYLRGKPHEAKFCAGRLNALWLTGIAEFSTPVGKVYLNPIIDCCDSLVMSWTALRSPSADFINTIIDHRSWDPFRRRVFHLA